MKCNIAIVLAAFLTLLTAGPARAQQSSPPGEPTSLSDLLDEAERNNPQIQAARHGWDSAKQSSTQVSTLPDPQFVLQHVSVGSPRPFAGYTNSDFAYVGLGISQDIPYPGKLRLRGEIASKEADVTQHRYESVRRTVLAAVKSNYLQLGYLAKQQAILDDDAKLLEQVEQAAEARYRSGMGNQHDVLQAQLERSKLLREITTNQLEAGKVQAEIKQILNRSQSSPDIRTAQLSETTIAFSYDQLLAAANSNNPEIAASKKMVERQALQVDLAKKDFYPDFNLQYMWQRTDPTQFRAYYSVTLGVRIPIYRSRRQQPELAQAQADQSRAKSEQEAQTQQIAFQLRQQFLTAEKSAQLLKIYREGLLPQARAELQAGMAAYQSNRQDFQALLASFLDVLKLDEEYWQTLSEHEAALAQIEAVTGLSLR
ncbi:MAG: TolC family protein [Acidobacteria bacterium]|nr:TolC family protein [Acidobacteriota bacterium]MBS1867572.1 TolC family protein [Acidobacteriota bacterium]